MAAPVTRADSQPLTMSASAVSGSREGSRDDEVENDERSRDALRDAYLQRVPNAIWLESPALKLVEGGYKKLPAVRVRQTPVWQNKRKFVIYRKPNGAWGVAENISSAHNDEDLGVHSVLDYGLDATPGYMQTSPHQAKAWAANGTVEENTAATAETVTTASYEQVIACLTKQQLRVRRFRHALFYFLYCVLIVLWVLSEWSSAMYWAKASVEREIAQDVWDAVSSRDEMFDAIDLVVPRIWSNALGVDGQNAANPTRQVYTERPLAADTGITLNVVSVETLLECTDLCDADAACRSVSFSQLCGRCFLQDRCVRPLDPAATPPNTCPDTRTYIVPCDPAAAQNVTAEPCPQKRVQVRLGCSGVLGSMDFNCATSQATVVEEGETPLVMLEVFPLGSMLLRQSRVDLQPCVIGPGENILSPELRAALPKECAPRYDASTSSSTPYGKNGRRFISDSLKPERRRYQGPPITTRVAAYDDQNRFTVAFNFESRLEDVLAEIKRMRDEWGWLDEQSRLVSLETMYFIPREGIFVHSILYAEFLENGLVDSSHHYYVFNILTLERVWVRLVLACDIMVLIGALLIARLGLRNKKGRRGGEDDAASPPASPAHGYTQLPGTAPKKRSRVAGCFKRIRGATNFGLIEISFFGCVIYGTYVRVQLWAVALEMSETFYDGVQTNVEANVAMFNWLSKYNQLLDAWNAILGVIALIALTRFLKFLQYTSKFRTLSDTVKQAGGDLLGVLVTCSPLLVAFGMGGAVIFGHGVKEFMTFPDAIESLVLFMLTQEMNDLYDDMTYVRGEFITAFFLGTYFIMSALLFLNLFLATIAGSYAMVSEQKGDTDARDSKPILEQTLAFLRDFFDGLCPYSKVTRRPHFRYSTPQVGAFKLTILELAGINEIRDEIIALRDNMRDWSDLELIRQAARNKRFGKSRLTALTRESLIIDSLTFRGVAKTGNRPLTHAESDWLFRQAETTAISGVNNRARRADRMFESLSQLIADLENRLSNSDNRFEYLTQQSRSTVGEASGNVDTQLVDIQRRIVESAGLTEEQKRTKLTTDVLSNQVKLVSVLLGDLKTAVDPSTKTESGVTSPKRRPQHREMGEVMKHRQREHALRGANPRAPLPPMEESPVLESADTVRRVPPARRAGAPAPPAPSAPHQTHTGYPLAPGVPASPHGITDSSGSGSGASSRGPASNPLRPALAAPRRAHPARTVTIAPQGVRFAPSPDAPQQNLVPAEAFAVAASPEQQQQQQQPQGPAAAPPPPGPLPPQHNSNMFG